MKIIADNPSQWNRWFNKLPNADQDNIEIALVKLRAFGRDLGAPASKPLGKGLFELRVTTKPPYRIMYRFDGDNAIILTFVKKTSPIAHQKAIDAAKKKL